MTTQNRIKTVLTIAAVAGAAFCVLLSCPTAQATTILHHWRTVKMKFIMTGCIVGLLFVATSVNAAIINGDVSAGGTMGGGWLRYQHVGSGAYHTNDPDDDGLAGSIDDGWSLSASTLDKDGTSSKDRGGAAWFIGDVSVTDWRFEYDFSGTTNGSTDIVLYLGLDDGDNLADTKVMGFGSTDGPEDGVAVDDAWTIVTAKVAVGSDNSLALPDLTGFDIMVMKIMNGETEGSFDNFELGSADPNLPEVDAGTDMITWSGEPVTMDANVVNNDTNEPPGTLTYLWTAEPNGIGDPDLDVAIEPNEFVEDPNVTITKAPGDAVTVTMTLAVTLPGKDPVKDTMIIDVYDDSCLAAKAAGTAAIDATDIDEDCITNFVDFAVMAITWLDDYTLTGPVVKP